MSVGSENLAYALTQVVHNFGAAAVLGAAVFALWPDFRAESARRFAWLILLGWGAQIASGAVFGLTSYYYYGATPDLSSLALAALAVKVAAATSAFLLVAVYLVRGRDWARARVRLGFQVLAALAATALTAAAFLRWFS
ncbi:MAG: hypothetical protein LDL19_05900 [Thiobacillus sp.]|nr:hypothetical protein [Thiobacillus sp.]